MLRLKELRSEKKVTQQQISEHLGVSRPTYTRYENGEREPSIEMIKKLAQFFQVSIDTLFGYNNETTPVLNNDGNQTSVGLQLEGMDVDIYECAHVLSDEDKLNVMRYIDFIKKRNQV